MNAETDDYIKYQKAELFGLFCLAGVFLPFLFGIHALIKKANADAAGTPKPELKKEMTIALSIMAVFCPFLIGSVVYMWPMLRPKDDYY